MADGKSTVYVKLGLQGATEITNTLDKLGKAGEAAFARIRAASEKATPGAGGKLDAGFARIKASYATISKASTDFGKTISYASQSFNGFNSALGATALKLGALKLALDTAAGGVFLLAKGAIDTVDELDRQSQALGFTIQGYTDLVGAAEAASVEQDVLAASLQKVNTFFEKQGDAADKAANRLENQIEAIRKNGKEGTDQSKAIEDATQKAVDAASEESTALTKLGLSYEELRDKSPEERLYALADAFQAAGSTAERNAAGVGLFGRGALKLVAFLAQGSAEIKKQSAEFRRYGFTVDDTQLKIAQLGDQALDRLTLALKGARLQLGLLFAPALTTGANAFAEFIAQNLDALKAWGKEAGDITQQFVLDIVNALKGLDGAVSNKWILDIRDAIQSIPPLAKSAFAAIKIAFETLAVAVTPLAKAINGIFGTELTGKGLIVAGVFLKLIGGFRLFGAAIKLFVLTPINSVIGVFRLLITVFPAIYSGLVGIGNVLAIVGPALIAFIAANPILATIIGTVAALAAGIAYLYTRQTELDRAISEATIGYGEYDDAVRRAADGTKEATNALLEQQEALLNNRRLAILDARDQVAAAQKQLDDIRAAQASANKIGLGAGFEGTKAMAVNELAAATAVLTEREKNLADAHKRVADAKKLLSEGNKDLTKELPKLGEAADKAADGFIRVKIHMGAAYTKIQEVPREADMAAKKVASASAQIDEALKNPTKANDDLLASVKDRADAFVNSMEEIVTRYKALTAAIKDETGGLEQGVVGSASDFKVQVIATFDAAKLAVENIITGIGQKWDTVFNKIIADAATLNTRLSEVGNVSSNVTGGPLPSLGGDPTANSTGESIKNAAAASSSAWAEAERLISASMAKIAEAGSIAATKIAVAFQSLREGIAATFSGVAQSIAASFAADGGPLQATFAAALQALVDAANLAGSQISQALGGAFDGLVSSASSVAAQVQNIFRAMVSGIEAQITRLQLILARLRAQIAAASAAASAKTEKRAGGGYIYGSGGPTQDNIPAWLSAGEYVLRNAAVKRIPRSFLNALNSGRFDFGDLMRRFMNMRFADGGLVGLPSISVPSFAMAGSGSSGSMSSLTLVLGGETFAGLTGPADTIARLERTAKVRKIRSTGRQNPYA